MLMTTANLNAAPTSQEVRVVAATEAEAILITRVDLSAVAVVVAVAVEALTRTQRTMMALRTTRKS